jgi:hypothetical protein
MRSKYRIVKRESFDLNNKLQVQFEPQHRFLGIFWFGFSESDCDCTWNRKFDTQKEAEEFLVNVDRINYPRAKDP